MKDPKLDLRTRAGRRKEIMDQVRTCGGFTIFWITDNHLRACVAEEMKETGELIPDNSWGFPIIKAKIINQRKKQTK